MIESPENDNPFWRFSLRVYAAPGVAQECLAVQDRFGVDVNRLLFAAWLGATRGVVLDEAALRRIDEAVAGWSTSVVQPLRAVRRVLEKTPEVAFADMQTLRKRIADTELLAEQTQQAMLYRLSSAVGLPTAEPGAAAAQRNIALFLASHGREAGAFSLPRLLYVAAADET